MSIMSKKEFAKYYFSLLKTSLKTFMFNLKHFGIKLAFFNMLGEFSILYIIKNKSFANNLRKKQHEIIYKTLTEKYSEYIEEYKTKKIQPGENSKIIWTFWAQGIDNAPTLVKKCIENIKINSGEYELKILTKDNFTQYTELPKEIVENENISLAHFSDILRMKLLSEYGGIWVDSTMFFTENVFSEFDNTPFNSCFLNDNGWCIFFMGGKPNKLFSFVSDILIEYNKEYDSFISYFLLDYLIEIAYNSFNECREYVDNATLKHPSVFYFIDNFSKTFNKEEFKNMCDKYKFFKLSYKNSKNSPFYDENNNLTYFGYFSKL